MNQSKVDDLLGAVVASLTDSDAEAWKQSMTALLGLPEEEVTSVDEDW